MNKNKEYRLKRKVQRKDYIIQDKNLTIKTLYCRNETKRNKIEQLEQKNEQLQNNWNTLKQKLEKTIKSIEKESLINFKKEKNCYQKVLNQMLEMEKENE